jgi:hypothetical protein
MASDLTEGASWCSERSKKYTHKKNIYVYIAVAKLYKCTKCGNKLVAKYCYWDNAFRETLSRGGEKNYSLLHNKTDVRNFVLKQQLSSRDANGVAYNVKSCHIKPWSSECATDQRNNTRKLREKPKKASMRIGMS